MKTTKELTENLKLIIAEAAGEPLTPEQMNLLDCLLPAILAALPSFLESFMQCISGGASGGYNPGDRDRC